MYISRVSNQLFFFFPNVLLYGIELPRFKNYYYYAIPKWPEQYVHFIDSCTGQQNNAFPLHGAIYDKWHIMDYGYPIYCLYVIQWYAL